MIVFFLVVLLIYGGLNTYVGLRTWQWLHVIAPLPVPRALYWVVFWLMACSFIIARLVAGRVPLVVTQLLAWIGSYWLATFLYAVLLLTLIDLVRLLNHWTGILSALHIPTSSLIGYTGAAVCVTLLAVVLYGTWRARTPVVTDYAITVPKRAGPHRDLTIALVSDTHLGYTNGNGRIREMVAMVNSLQPDLILIAGDLIDDTMEPFLVEGMATELGSLQARIGTYAIMGNHDARTEQLTVFRAELERVGIRLLIDEWITVKDSFVLAGRNDNTVPRSSGTVAPIAELLRDVDRALPLIMMDHNPIRFADSVAAGVDIQVSGHTHAGQMFPFTLITQRVYGKDWGYLKQQATHVIISSGFGTWGPPMRVGTRPEVVRIRVTFAPQDGP